MLAERPRHPDTDYSEFEHALARAHPSALRGERIATLMLNVGLRCNLACNLCHHSCSPSHAESMSRDVMLQALSFASESRPELLDITGGEPTLWPLLGELVVAGRGVADRVRVRTNLEALLLPELSEVAHLLAENRVEILASLPATRRGAPDDTRIEALARLSTLGYGDPARGASIALDLAYNPLPGLLARGQDEITDELSASLAPRGVHFRSLLALANVPVGSFSAWLESGGERARYDTALRDGFNPCVLPQLACRHGIEIAWDGTLWDCDFNLAAGVPLTGESRYVGDCLGAPEARHALARRRIAFADHCFACSAGPGSS